MNRQIFSAATILAFSQLTYAASQVSNYGPIATTGPTSNHLSIFSAAHNPAMGALTVAKDESWRLSYFAGFNTRTEVGAVDNFSDDLDELIDILEEPESVTDSIDETLDRFNVVVAQMGEEGYLKSTTSITAPVFPLHFKSEKLGGTLSFEIANDTQIRLSVLDSPLVFNEQNLTIDTATSAYIKSGIENRASIGYAREMFSSQMKEQYGAKLYLGAKLNIVNLRLSKQVFLLTQLDGQDIDEVIEDEYDKNLVSSTNASLDIGAIWAADKYRVGFTISNLNQPSFDYGAIGVDCATRAEGSPERSNCEVIAAFTVQSGEIKKYETHEKYAVATVDGTYFIKDNWSVSASMDLASYDDIVGTQNQWFNLATAYYPNNRWIPAARFGYRKNLEGSNLASANIGFTFFKVFNLDIEYGLESVTVDGSSGPRSFAFGFSFEESF